MELGVECDLWETDETTTRASGYWYVTEWLDRLRIQGVVIRIARFDRRSKETAVAALTSRREIGAAKAAMYSDRVGPFLLEGRDFLDDLFADKFRLEKRGLSLETMFSSELNHESAEVLQVARLVDEFRPVMMVGHDGDYLVVFHYK